VGFRCGFWTGEGDVERRSRLHGDLERRVAGGFRFLSPLVAQGAFPGARRRSRLHRGPGVPAATGSDLQFFIIYETESPQVLASPAYVARLNNPTPMTQQVMPKLKNFVRGAGRVVQSNGVCGGGAAKVMRFEQSHPLLGDAAARSVLFGKIGEMHRVLAVRLFEVDTAATTIQTEEKKIRTSREEIYTQLLVIEAVDFEAFDAVSELLNATLLARENSRPPYDQSYQFITELQGRSLT
jgi:hypothetical protein